MTEQEMRATIHRQRETESCRRCAGSGQESANCGAELVAVLLVLIVWDAGWFCLGAWLR